METIKKRIAQDASAFEALSDFLASEKDSDDLPELEYFLDIYKRTIDAANRNARFIRSKVKTQILRDRKRDELMQSLYC